MIFILWDTVGGNIWNGTELVVLRLPAISGQLPPKLSQCLPKPARRDVVMLICLPPTDPAWHFFFTRSPCGLPLPHSTLPLLCLLRLPLPPARP